MKKQQKIYLDEESSVLIEQLAKSKTEGVNTGLKTLSYSRYVVFKVVNRLNKRVFFGVDATIDYFGFPVLLRLSKGDNFVSNDIEQFGRGAFETEPIGFFPTKMDAILYKDRLINEEMDKSVVLYNNEIYKGDIPRVISLKVSIKLARILSELSKKKKIPINTIIVFIIKKFLIKK